MNDDCAQKTSRRADQCLILSQNDWPLQKPLHVTKHSWRAWAVPKYYLAGELNKYNAHTPATKRASLSSLRALSAQGVSSAFAEWTWSRSRSASRLIHRIDCFEQQHGTLAVPAMVFDVFRVDRGDIFVVDVVPRRGSLSLGVPVTASFAEDGVVPSMHCISSVPDDGIQHIILATELDRLERQLYGCLYLFAGLVVSHTIDVQHEVVGHFREFGHALERSAAFWARHVHWVQSAHIRLLQNIHQCCFILRGGYRI